MKPKSVEFCLDNGKNVSLDLTSSKNYDWNSNLVEDGVVKHALVFQRIDSEIKIDLSALFSDVSLFDITNKYDMKVQWGAFCNRAKSEPSLIDGLESFLSKFGLTCNKVSIELGYDQLSNVVSTGELSLIEYYAWKSLLPKDCRSLLVFEFPDAFLDFKSARLLVEDLNSLDAQTIMRTNNVTLLDNDITRPDCCFIATKDGIRSFDKSTDREIRKAHNLEKMYVNGVFG